MPTFDTPEAISATIQLTHGDIRIIASDRTDTVVEVRPTDPADDADVQAAEQTLIEYANGRLLVKAPKTKARWWLFEWAGSINVTIDLPAGSRVDATAAASFRCDGRLGDSRFSTASGNIWLDQTGNLRLNSGDGDISVARSVGNVDATTGNGQIRIREIAGTALVKTTNGNIALGEVSGDARLNTANGDIAVDRCGARVGAKTSSGSVRIGETVRGWVDLETAYGSLEVGVRDGTAAWLDLNSLYGDVRVDLDPDDGPGPSDETVEVRARTAYGDVLIRRS